MAEQGTGGRMLAERQRRAQRDIAYARYLAVLNDFGGPTGVTDSYLDRYKGLAKQSRTAQGFRNLLHEKYGVKDYSTPEEKQASRFAIHALAGQIRRPSTTLPAMAQDTSEAEELDRKARWKRRDWRRKNASRRQQGNDAEALASQLAATPTVDPTAPLTAADFEAMRQLFSRGPNPALTAAYDGANRAMASELAAAQGGIGMAFDRGNAGVAEQLAASRQGTADQLARLAAITAGQQQATAGMQANLTGATDGGAAMGLIPVTGAVGDVGAAAAADAGAQTALAQNLGNINASDLGFLQGLMGAERGAQTGAASNLQATNRNNLALQYAKLLADQQSASETAAMSMFADEQGRRSTARLAAAKSTSATPPDNPLTVKSKLARHLDRDLNIRQPRKLLGFSYVGEDGRPVQGGGDLAGEKFNPQAIIGEVKTLVEKMPANQAEGLQLANELWTKLAAQPAAVAFLRWRYNITGPRSLAQRAYGG